MAQKLVVLIIFGYLLGSIPFAQIIAHARANVNLREVGEGNVGSRNVWHTAGPAWGVLAFLLDAFKGFVAYDAAVDVGLPLAGVLLVGAAALLGHQFPIYLRGRGGKGMATGAGILFAITPLSTVVGIALIGLAYPVLHNFDWAVAVGAVAIVVLPFVFRQPPWVPAYAVALGLLLGAKKVLDRPHEMRVMAQHPWQDNAQPDFQRPAEGDADAPAHDAPPR